MEYKSEETEEQQISNTRDDESKGSHQTMQETPQSMSVFEIIE